MCQGGPRRGGGRSEIAFGWDRRGAPDATRGEAGGAVQGTASTKMKATTVLPCGYFRRQQQARSPNRRDSCRNYLDGITLSSAISIISIIPPAMILQPGRSTRPAGTVAGRARSG